MRSINMDDIKIRVYSRGDSYKLIDDSTNQPIIDEWFMSPNWSEDHYDPGEFHDNWSLVKLDYKFNFINKLGVYLNPFNWFDNAYPFSNGLAVVEDNGIFNYITLDGRYLCATGFDWAGSFCDGVAVVELHDRFNYINTNGEYILPDWKYLVFNITGGRS